MFVDATNRWRADLRVGILGGGQLAKMLYEAGAPLGLSACIYAASAEEPAGRIAARLTLGRLEDVERLEVFLSQLDLAIFENEFVDTQALRRAAKGFPKLAFQPSLETIDLLRDKLEQKRLLESLKLPTAPFLALDGRRATSSWKEACLKFPRGFILKWGRLGYDGKGLFFAPDPERDMAGGVAFLEEAGKRDVSCYAEELVAFQRELALVACRGLDGSFVCYPLVISEQERGICVRVRGPAVAYGVAHERQEQAAAIAREVAQASGVVGCFALEFFETASGLLVNELAPRVHNSGHFSQDASLTSQYENHWRAVLGLPLGSTDSWPAFAMWNVLGPEGISTGPQGLPLPAMPAGAHLHWYGKYDIRPRRKIGHVNLAASSPQQLSQVERDLGVAMSSWESRLRGRNGNGGDER